VGLSSTSACQGRSNSDPFAPVESGPLVSGHRPWAGGRRGRECLSVARGRLPLKVAERVIVAVVEADFVSTGRYRAAERRSGGRASEGRD
jgi:hypothetical protein